MLIIIFKILLIWYICRKIYQKFTLSPKPIIRTCCTLRSISTLEDSLQVNAACMSRISLKSLMREQFDITGRDIFEMNAPCNYIYISTFFGFCPNCCLSRRPIILSLVKHRDISMIRLQNQREFLFFSTLIDRFIPFNVSVVGSPLTLLQPAFTVTRSILRVFVERKRAFLNLAPIT